MAMPTTLYLVSAEATASQLAERLMRARRDGIDYVLHPEDEPGLAARYLALWPLLYEGIGYWKVGITHHADPLKRNQKAYREAFRAIEYACEDDAREIELKIARQFAAIAPSVHGREAAAYSLDFGSVCEIFDACVEGREPVLERNCEQVERKPVEEPMWV